MRIRKDQKSELRQRSTLAAAGEAQDIFRQPMCGIDIGLAAIYQHPAQATFQYQFHLLCHHGGIIYLQGS